MKKTTVQSRMTLGKKLNNLEESDSVYPVLIALALAIMGMTVYSVGTYMAETMSFWEIPVIGALMWIYDNLMERNSL